MIDTLASFVLVCGVIPLILAGVCNVNWFVYGRVKGFG